MVAAGVGAGGEVAVAADVGTGVEVAIAATVDAGVVVAAIDVGVGTGSVARPVVTLGRGGAVGLGARVEVDFGSEVRVAGSSVGIWKLALFSVCALLLHASKANEAITNKKSPIEWLP